LPTLEPWARPPSCIALTGILSRRFDVSAARRMSASPIVRTSLALALNCGELGSVDMSASTYPDTLASRPGSAVAGTAGASFGAAVAATAWGGAGAVRVSMLSCGAGGASGAGCAAAAPGLEGNIGSLIGVLPRRGT